MRHSRSFHLYLDIGNTRAKWALAYPNSHRGEWYQYGVYSHQQHTSVAFLEDLKHYPIEKVWCANVAGTQIQVLFEKALSRFDVPPSVQYVTAMQHYLHLHNCYEEPHQLGVDRWLAALAASYFYAEQNLLIVSMGTATTIDAVNAKAHFLGGWILPGLTTMLASLGQSTAQLPILETPAQPTARLKYCVARCSESSCTCMYTPVPALRAPCLLTARDGCARVSLEGLSCADQQPSFPVQLQDEPYNFEQNHIANPNPFGCNTLHAIYQGCLASQIGAIKHCFNLSRMHMGVAPTFILTGGARQAIVDKLDFPIIEIPDLVLQGLQIYADN